MTAGSPACHKKAAANDHHVMRMQLGYLAVEHGKLAAKNIQAAIQGKPLKAWKPNGGMSVRRLWLQHSMASCGLGPAVV
jgi:NADH dehydrogenase FAD-containing subunit